jgi:LAO/AO transport system kinase
MQELIQTIRSGDRRALARAITIVENELEGYEELLQQLSSDSKIPVIGFTGPPGAGKSTLINGLLHHFTQQKKKIAVVAVDPTSPFNYGSLLGDRLRLSEFFNHPDVFIRSLATRGSLGGLCEKIIEITDVLRIFSFDYIFVETVGVGQSEVEIAGLADTTAVVFVPESGDEIQTMKRGIMEIADVFVVNKSDRPGADLFAANLKQLIENRTKGEIPVMKTSAINREGIEALAEFLAEHSAKSHNNNRTYLLTEKAYRLIQRQRMKGISREELHKKILEKETIPGFNLYRFVQSIG